VKIDEDAIAVRGRRFERRDDVRANPANGRFLNIDREKAPSADCFARHSSVRLRRISRVSGAAFEPSSDWSHFRASGLMVAGMGTTRVMCAVPSESKVAESAAGELVAEGFVAAHPARRNARNRDKEGSGRCIGTSKSGINARRSQKPRQLTCSAPSVLHPANTARYV
jgi:hypothetical protein